MVGVSQCPSASPRRGALAGAATAARHGPAGKPQRCIDSAERVRGLLDSVQEPPYTAEESHGRPRICGSRGGVWPMPPSGSAPMRLSLRAQGRRLSARLTPVGREGRGQTVRDGLWPHEGAYACWCLMNRSRSGWRAEVRTQAISAYRLSTPLTRSPVNLSVGVVTARLWPCLTSLRTPMIDT